MALNIELGAVLKEAIDKFVAVADKKSAQYYTEMRYTHSAPPIHKAEILSDKWVRVVTLDEYGGMYKTGCSAYAFIAISENTTKALGTVIPGDVHKPASYKVPAKHARGNVFVEGWENALTAFGIVYLK